MREGPALPPASSAERVQPAWSFRPVPPHPPSCAYIPTARYTEGQETEDSLEEEPAGNALTSWPEAPRDPHPGPGPQSQRIGRHERAPPPSGLRPPWARGAARAPPAAKAVPTVELRDLTCAWAGRLARRSRIYHQRRSKAAPAQNTPMAGGGATWRSWDKLRLRCLVLVVRLLGAGFSSPSGCCDRPSLGAGPRWGGKAGAALNSLHRSALNPTHGLN